MKFLEEDVKEQQTTTKPKPDSKVRVCSTCRIRGVAVNFCEDEECDCGIVL